MHALRNGCSLISRLGVLLLTTTMLLSLVDVRGAGAADEDLADALSTLVTAVPDATSQAHLTTAFDVLPAGLPTPGESRVADARRHVPDAYVDGVRLAPERGQDAYLADLRFVSYLAPDWAGPNDPLGAALVQVVAASRLTAATAVADVEASLGTTADPTAVVATAAEDAALRDDVEAGGDPLEAVADVVDPQGRAAAERSLRQAQQSLDRADAARSKGLAVAAVTHDGQAWRHGVNALEHLGISYGGDRDGDGVLDVVELRVGSSPLRADSDGDGLTDAYEVDNTLGTHWPATADSDRDGTLDGAEDVDGDGLDARTEQSVGTDALDPDTDADGLTDGEEVASGTDPLSPDTDGDGLLDSVEPMAGTDPTVADTDGDGILDGDEQLTFDVPGPDGVRARVTGTGDLASPLEVLPVTADPRADAAVLGQLGTAYEFSLPPAASDRMLQAEIVLPFDASSLPAGTDPAADLRVFWLDESTQAWVPAADGQVVDVAGGTVTAVVDHFSTYAIFSITNWEQTWTARQNPCRDRRGDGGGGDVVLLDLTLVLDSSGSMSWNDPTGLRRTAAKSFVDALLDEDRAAVVDFDSNAVVLQGLTTDKTVVKTAIDRVDSSGGTDIGDGVKAANQILIANGDDSRARMMIVLTDGQGGWDPQALVDAKVAGITIYTVGLGSGVDSGLLTSIATETGGQYYPVASAEDLPEVFREIEEDTGSDPGVDVDTDGDGLNDCIEVEGAQSATTWQRYPSDPTDPDTDGDGIPDGEEVVPSGPVSGIPAEAGLYAILSDPALIDTDGDGVDDGTELDDGSSAWSGDRDGDGLADSDEREWQTDPNRADTDGDGFSDGEEVADLAAGFQPNIFDDPLTPAEWAAEFAEGMAKGDAGDGDTVAYLLGSLASSGLSFIPVVGWIAGLVTDLRDAIGNTIKGEWAAAGMSIVGVVPYIGDAANISSKVTRFLLKNGDKTDEALAALAKLDDIPASVRMDALLRLRDSVRQLKDAGLADDAVLRLAGSRVGLDKMTETLRRASSGSRLGFVTSWRRGETLINDDVASTVGLASRSRFYSTRGSDLASCCARIYDTLDADLVGHEVKTGFVNFRSRIARQIEKDAALVADGSTDLQGVVWHFVASNGSSSVGADPRVLDLLDDAGIPYIIHLP